MCAQRPLSPELPIAILAPMTDDRPVEILLIQVSLERLLAREVQLAVPAVILEDRGDCLAAAARPPVPIQSALCGKPPPALGASKLVAPRMHRGGKMFRVIAADAEASPAELTEGHGGKGGGGRKTCQWNIGKSWKKMQAKIELRREP